MASCGVTFSPRTNKSNRYCSVPQCNSKARSHPELRFNRFPPLGQTFLATNSWGLRERCERRKIWINVLKIGKPVSNTMLVCSRHFKKDDYILPDVPAKLRCLKKTAVPSCNLPVASFEKSRKERSSREQTRHRLRTVVQPIEPMRDVLGPEQRDVVEVHPNYDLSHEVESHELEAAEALLVLGNVKEKTFAEISVQVEVERKDFSCQVCSGDFDSNFIDVIDNQRKLTTMTGITFEMLSSILYLFSLIRPESNRGSFDNKGMVVMTLMKLRLNLSFAVMSILFSCSATTCKNIFASTLRDLSKILRYAIKWPSKEEIVKNMPRCFEKFKRVRVVLDCTEVHISKFRCLKCRILSYSHYKGHHTVKYMIGVTPGGIISYLSAGYGGRASDRKIFEESNLIDHLEPHFDDVMVDKGFLIKGICENNFVGVIHPSFLRKNKKFSKGDAVATSEIAKAHVHVERAIERVKKFKMLSERIPVTLCHLADKMMVVACGITNLSGSILAEEKFLNE